MQAIKEKISDLKEIRKAKAEAKEEERAERELAKSRLEVAHEVRMAREAEAAMDYHVQKAAEKAAEHERKFGGSHHGSDSGRNSSGRNSGDISYSGPGIAAPLETIDINSPSPQNNRL